MHFKLLVFIGSGSWKRADPLVSEQKFNSSFCFSKTKSWIISTALMQRTIPWQSDWSSEITWGWKRLKDALDKGHFWIFNCLVLSLHYILHNVEDHNNKVHRITWSKWYWFTSYIQSWSGVMFDSELRGWFLSYLETRIVTTLFEAKNT